MFKIDKHIPLPTVNKESASRYPFDDMEIGDSFIASTDVKHFNESILKIQNRNDSGDGRLFHWIATRDSLCEFDMLRVWRISPKAYLDLNPEEKEILDWIVRLVKKLGPMTRSQIAYNDLANGAGSKAKRYQILDKYAFLFKVTPGKTHGLIYEIA